jgi:hypothetical protein
MKLKRRTKKLATSVVNKISGRHSLICKECEKEELEVSSDIRAITCAKCVQKMIAPPEFTTQRKPESERFPRGWHFKARYVHTDGKIYVRGKLTDEVETPDPTPRKKKNSKVKIHKKVKKNVQTTK